MPDGSVEATIESGAGSASDAQTSPSDTGLSRPSGDIVAPLDNSPQPAGSSPGSSQPEQNHQLEEFDQPKSPSPLPSPVSGEQSEEQKESGQYGDDRSFANAKIQRLRRIRRAALDAMMVIKTYET